MLIVPPVEKDRYFSIQLIDAYTHNFAYIGSRATGNDGGNFLVVGPHWDGTTPKGVKKVIRARNRTGIGTYRNAAFQSWVFENVKKVQAGYKAKATFRVSGATCAESSAGHQL